MKRYIYKYALLIGAVALWSCEPKVDEFKPNSGTADFSKFVAIGDSYTAGYTDGALSKSGQESSFAYIVAKQMMHTGLSSFDQPLLPDGKSIGSSGNGSFYLVETGNPASPVIPFTQVPGDIELLTDPTTWINGQYQNIGVPGAKSIHMVTPLYGDPSLGAGNFNPFFARFTSNPGTSSMLDDAVSNDPSFFSCWMAGNDVLTYALAGGEGGVGTGTTDITDEMSFAGAMNLTLQKLTMNGAKGVIGNIPEIESIPNISYIKYDDLVIDATTAAALNAGYAQYNAAATANGLPTMDFAEGRNAFVIADASHPLTMRQIKEGEKILLSALSGIQGDDKWGSASPLPESQVLDLEEVANIENATVSFNSILKDLAQSYDLAFVDANALLKELGSTGIIIDGHHYTGTFVTGGIFSLDGIHTTGRGSAIIANEFIDAINAKYDATIPRANINDYDMVMFP